MIKFCPYCLKTMSLFATKCPHCLSIQPSFIEYFPILFWAMIIISACLFGAYIFTSYILFFMIMCCTIGCAVLCLPFYLFYIFHKK